ncbi:flagellar assembly protein FliX [Dongia soli]|uniref:Flagellar assembly protein FliX n=1 Tax=Dongia soli TaxID=600628 RepID=A0ABU5EAD4_9PROT|nr:flagellar assembly protein FliX [Dongia soli]MDY0882831.1 flagellar assembly protein FliX [Dongia soli]
MKIDPTGTRPTAARKAGGTTTTGSTDFAKNLAEPETAGAARMQSPVGLNSLAALLTVQETDETLGRRARSRAKQRGESILDQLEEIRLGLLLGVIPMAKLEGLAQLVRAKREQFQDPELQSILDEIELRAAVELAKLSRSV